jgi:hypothetical protein
VQFELRFDMGVNGLQWGIDPLHNGELRSIEARRALGVNQFVATRPLLPYQGVQVWWRPETRTAPAGEPEREATAVAADGSQITPEN